jgi:hypothetical protein
MFFDNHQSTGDLFDFEKTTFEEAIQIGIKCNVTGFDESRITAR